MGLCRVNHSHKALPKDISPQILEFISCLKGRQQATILLPIFGFQKLVAWQQNSLQIDNIIYDFRVLEQRVGIKDKKLRRLRTDEVITFNNDVMETSLHSSPFLKDN